MRIQAIQLAWFRGAAESVALNANCKSMVVYGVNGAGKSSFVDAVEYVLSDGKIRHLAHEYSGKRQEKAVPNTHTPKEQATELRIELADKSDAKVQVSKDGTSTSSGGALDAMRAWDYRRTILRQDEVAAFIHDTKGGKYSALLPLLGLHQMEIAAENLRQLAKVVENKAKVRETRTRWLDVKATRTTTFRTDTDEQIGAKVDALHATYCADKTTTSGLAEKCAEIGAAIDLLVGSQSADQRKHLTLRGIAELRLKENIEAVRSASSKLADQVEPMIAEKLEVLQPTAKFVDALTDAKEVSCPACGRSIAVSEFRAHVDAERKRLEDIIEVFESRKAAINLLCTTLAALKLGMSKADIKAWRSEVAQEPLTARIVFLEAVEIETVRSSCGEDSLAAFESNLVPLIDAAAHASRETPAETQQLLVAKQTAAAAKTIFDAAEQMAATERAEKLVAFISALEQGTREEIRARAKAVIEEISSDIRTMWAILHPAEAIEGVHLYVPEATDKAIDIGLTFYGVQQESPRLTLSEGFRNGLGLCIYLAMAKREAAHDRPLFLDDVVISLDRNHRGMIVELLEKEFGGRQVVILTHDREWYTELRQQLAGKNWEFGALLPYETPHLGIRWSHKTTTFDDARAQLADRPDSAGNDARKIMDVELALLAERLQIRLPYLRADKNDRRMAHDFLERLAADGKQCFQVKVGGEYVVHLEAIDAFQVADVLLVSWANRGSHTFDVVKPEASKLIEACEKAVAFFRCTSCGKGVWFANAEGSELVQCQCSQIRWRYGKG